MTPRTILATGALVLMATAAAPAPDGWHRTLDDGVAAAKRSGKPVLVVTMWKQKL